MGDVNRKVELKTEMVGMKGSELGNQSEDSRQNFRKLKSEMKPPNPAKQMTRLDYSRTGDN